MAVFDEQVRFVTICSAILLALTINVIAVPSSYAYNDQASTLDRRAGEALEKGDRRLAEKLYLQALKIGGLEGFGFSENPADHLASLYMEEKRYSEAERFYLQSKTITARDFPGDLRLQMQIDVALGSLYLRSNQTEKALAAFRKACKAWLIVAAKDDEPSMDLTFPFVAQLAKCSFKLSNEGRNAEAETFAKAASDITSKMADRKFYSSEITRYSCLLGKMYYRNKKYKLASEVLERSIGRLKGNFTLLDWELAEPAHYFALSCNALNQPKKCSEFAKSLKANWPESVFQKSDEWGDAFVRGAAGQDGYCGDGDLDQAREAIRLAKKFGPNDFRLAESEARLAIVLHDDGKYEEAPAHFKEAIRILELSLSNNRNAIAMHLERWGKLTEPSYHHTSEAPWPVYMEALRIRKEITKANNEDAFKGAKQIADYCKNCLARTNEDEVFTMYADACNVMSKARPISNSDVLDAFHDLIAVREKRYQYDRTPATHAPTIALYEQVLKGEKLAYGADSLEVKETAGNLVEYLRRVQMNDLANRFARDYSVR